MSALEEALADYLRLRRGLGHKLDAAGRDLARFVTYLDDMGAETVTMTTTLAFVLDPDLPAGSTVPGQRLQAVRGFARYLVGIYPTTEIPPSGIVSGRARRRVPHIFSDEDVAAVVGCAVSATPFPFRQATLTTVINLLAVTGMRVGEALRLGRGDVDFDEAVILVRDTKFGKDRDLPVSASTIDALAGYASERDRTRPASSRFFVSLRGTPVASSHFSMNFRDAVALSAIGAGSGIRPRIHDLRHSFAVRTLLNWYRAGLDVEALLPRLSTYLGHREPRFTYRYLSGIPELLGHAVNRLEAAQSVTP